MARRTHFCPTYIEYGVCGHHKSSLARRFAFWLLGVPAMFTLFLIVLGAVSNA